MEVNASMVKELRCARGWTQQHLADACDLSLRTIQRVEKTGLASNETLLGLCAVFDIDQGALHEIPKPEPEQMAAVTNFGLPLAMAISSLVGALVGAGVTYLVLG